MRFFADLHIHSRYSPGTHPDMEIPTLVKWAKIKGVTLLGTGDFTHPQWLVELKKFLKPSSGRGVYEYEDVRFVLTAEVSCLVTGPGRGHKVHHLILAPNFSAADKLTSVLGRFGDMDAEALPALSLSAEDLVKAVLDASPDSLVVPAHVSEMNQSLLSPAVGVERWEQAYGASASQIRAVETGLAADPAVLRGVSGLDALALVSGSDARHPSHVGREAVLFDCPLDYKEMAAALAQNDRRRFVATVETFAEEDRYFSAGHKACRARAAKQGPKTLCPACGETAGPSVRDRLADLADRPPAEAAERAGLFHRVMGLRNVIADVMGFQPEADSVQRQYVNVTSQLGSELEILVLWPEQKLRDVLPLRLAEGVLAMRRGDVDREPGYDGVPGRVRVQVPSSVPNDPGQLRLF
jgi:DNA helicase II / ATP-dependent DNA helicase PcrA